MRPAEPTVGGKRRRRCGRSASIHRHTRDPAQTSRVARRSDLTPFLNRVHARCKADHMPTLSPGHRSSKARAQRKLMNPGGFKRSFFNDCVLAASCRECGLTLITQNRNDFDLIRKVHPFDYTEPWPA